MCIYLGQITLHQAGGLGDVTLQGSASCHSDAGYVRWQTQYCAYPTDVQPKTWGMIKSLYRGY